MLSNDGCKSQRKKVTAPNTYRVCPQIKVLFDMGVGFLQPQKFIGSPAPAKSKWIGSALFTKPSLSSYWGTRARGSAHLKRVINPDDPIIWARKARPIKSNKLQVVCLWSVRGWSLPQNRLPILIWTNLWWSQLCVWLTPSSPSLSLNEFIHIEYLVVFEHEIDGPSELVGKNTQGFALAVAISQPF